MVHRIYHLDRGYEALDRKLVQCGADIDGSANERGAPACFFVGVDGGGTGCRARIEDADGPRAGHRALPGPAALRLGIDASLAAVEQACRAALEEARSAGRSAGRMPTPASASPASAAKARWSN